MSTDQSGPQGNLDGTGGIAFDSFDYTDNTQTVGEVSVFLTDNTLQKKWSKTKTATPSGNETHVATFTAADFTDETNGPPLNIVKVECGPEGNVVGWAQAGANMAFVLDSATTTQGSPGGLLNTSVHDGVQSMIPPL